MSNSLTTHNLYFSINELNKVDWNFIKTDSVFLTINYLQSIESTVSDVTQFIYVIYYDGKKKPIGKSVFQLLHYDTSTFNFDSIPCNFRNNILRRFLNKNLTILIAGNIFSTGENGFYFNDSFSSKNAFIAINKAIKSIEKSNKQINYTVFKEFLNANNHTEILTRKYNYLKFNIDVNMVLTIKNTWQNFEDIASEFKTKYRSRSNAILQKSKAITIKEFTLLDIENNAIKLEELYQQVLKNSNFNIGIFTLNTFIKLKENLPNNYSLFGYYVNGKLIGFRSAFINNTVLETSFIGIDYSVNKNYNLYQKMLMDFVTYGLENNLQSIGFGRTAETIKSCVGAQPVDLDLFIKSRKLYGKLLLKILVKNINPTEFSLRSPFRKEFY